MIIWISGYPKSGNTWTRVFLSNYLYEKKIDPFHNLKYISDFPRTHHFNFLNSDEKNTLNNQNDNFKFYLLAQDKINLNGKINLIKTHSFAGSLSGNHFSNSENTIGFIYLVRDPRSVAISLSYHLNLTIEKTVELMVDSNRFAIVNEELITFWSSWKINYLSWKRLKYPKLILKYEDLHFSPKNKFKEILEFLSKFQDVQINDSKIDDIIEHCSFSKLKSFEKNNGFKEKQGGEYFFREGRIDEWKKKMDLNLINKIEKEFKDEMLELGYL